MRHIQHGVECCNWCVNLCARVGVDSGIYLVPGDFIGFLFLPCAMSGNNPQGGSCTLFLARGTWLGVGVGGKYHN